MEKIINHNDFTSYRLDKLNDKQRNAIFQEFNYSDITFISIGEKLSSKIILKNGSVYEISFSLIGIKKINKL